MKFAPNRPVETTEPRVVVDTGLPAGRHRFQLVVVNRAGQASKPVAVDVVINPQGTVIPGRIDPSPRPGPIVIGPLRPPFPP